MPRTTLPTHLAQPAALGEVQGEPIAQFEIGSYQNFVYLILDWDQKKAAWVDPQSDLTAPLKVLTQYGFELQSILLTHTHFDHIAGVPQLVQMYPNVPVHLHNDDLHRLNSDLLHHEKFKSIQDGDVIQIGKHQVQVLHTPGHSAGEVSFFLQDTHPYLFSGDTIFIRDCGRTDLGSGSNEQMFASLQKIKKLPPETILLPGHHYRQECASTLEDEFRESPPFQCKTIQELTLLP